MVQGLVLIIYLPFRLWCYTLKKSLD